MEHAPPENDIGSSVGSYGNIRGGEFVVYCLELSFENYS